MWIRIRAAILFTQLTNLLIALRNVYLQVLQVEGTIDLSAVFRIRIRLIRIRIRMRIQPKISIRIRIPDPGSGPCQVYRKNNF